ncbi:tripartite tricarboxylate transporter TctB family protein [Aquabacterium sp.]|uniref:tripartite tricarboxylate transporter TctB family protein n=1 Tax=Aquabacterium sp. TaxID=1872578 RepID=UPI002D094BCD|nr:tripartite tricarboxylate transporter TctB family protein [Aquabacterium sp.]HSW03221.1 tripartite tricarboxylate transporter TctB family protein [Aquabacterium sp.]
MPDIPEKDSAAVATRWPELLVALTLLVLALLVIVDSVRVGHGWADDGPRAGYFPFYIGIGLAAVSLVLIVDQLRRWRQDQRVFVLRQEAAGVIAVAWPMVVYVALIWPLGIYVASVVLIAFFMRRHGHFAWWLCALIALLVPVLLFLVFERWFSVPLPKGPLEHWLGY